MHVFKQFVKILEENARHVNFNKDGKVVYNDFLDIMVKTNPSPKSSKSKLGRVIRQIKTFVWF